MAKKFKQLTDKMSPKARMAAEVKTQALLSKMALSELREAMEYTQSEIADTMELQQPAVSKIEKNTDMYISTLRRYIESMGGELEIKATFGDGEAVRINQFECARKAELA